MREVWPMSNDDLWLVRCAEDGDSNDDDFDWDDDTDDDSDDEGDDSDES